VNAFFGKKNRGIFHVVEPGGKNEIIYFFKKSNYFFKFKVLKNLTFLRSNKISYHFPVKFASKLKALSVSTSGHSPVLNSKADENFRMERIKIKTFIIDGFLSNTIKLKILRICLV
jgi:hypothetical protein